MFSRAWSPAALVITALIAALADSPSAHARDDDALRGDYVVIKATLAFAGSSDLDSDSIMIPFLGTTFNLEDASGWNDDLELSNGASAQYMWDLHRYFALGGLFGVFSWQTDFDDDVDADRNLAFDLAIVPQGRLPLTDAIELYVAVPIGVSLDLLNQFDRSAIGGNVRSEGDSAVGFTLSALVGARFALSRSFGLLAEVGYTYHTYSHEVTISGGNMTAAKVNGDLSIGQIALNAGVWF